MNLQKLLEVQKKLDARIESEHPRKFTDYRIEQKIMALQVEIAELANVLPEVFKFWSNKKNDREKALEEFVDGLHFILSIANETNVTLERQSIELEPSIFFQFAKVFWLAAQLYDDDYVNELFNYYMNLGWMLGFSEEQIEKAYLEKNIINHQRQEDGY